MLPSENVPVAVNCCWPPGATLEVDGVTAIEIATGGVTVALAVPLKEFRVAVIVVGPCVTLLACP